MTCDRTAAARRLLLAALAAAALLLSAPAGALAAPAPSRWCGSDESSKDRVPDAIASYQLHAVYAIPSDGTDGFFQLALPIARDLAAIDSWWRLQDPTRTLRWDLQAFPGCDSVFGGLDIAVVRLPQTGSVYAPIRTTGYQALVRDLSGVFPDPYKKYAVYYDGPVAPDQHICGISSLGPIERGASFAVTLVSASPGAFCGSVGGSDYMAVTMAHEIIHNLGAVFPEAPHQCDGGHVCDAVGDIMRSFGGSNSLFDYALDIGHDDYYAHSGAWWDVQDSAWLSHLDTPQFTLTVTRSGAGQGSVSSDLPGIACPSACSIAWDSGTKVSLNATPDGDRTRFAGWTGACSGDSFCEVTMDAAKTVGAEFHRESSLALSIVKRGGAGRVVSNPEGIDCTEAGCDSLFDSDSKVVLTATPDRRSRLVAWSVPSCAAQPKCPLIVAADRSVSATFGPGSYRLTAAVQGRGRITSIPAGISCTRSCAAPFPYGRSVRLVAKPAKEWRFAGWSGDCRGRTACLVKIRRASLVHATFRRA